MDFLRNINHWHICEGSKALKRKLCFIPPMVSNKYLFYAFIFDWVGWLAQNCSLPFHDTLGTDGHASLLSLYTCSMRTCRQLLGEEVFFIWRC